MIRYAIFAAVSSKPQAAEDKISLPEQIRLCTQDAASRGWLQTAGPFIVPGHTRTRYINLRDAEQNIPALKDMLDAASRRDFDILLLYHYNRLRELLDPVAKTLQAYGIQLTAHTSWTEPQPPETYDPLSDIGTTLRFASSFTSAAEITEFRRRYRQGMPARILKGLNKGKIPYGYRKPPGHEYDRKAIVEPHPLHAPTVITIKDLFLQGQSLWQIAHTLNAKNIPSPRGKTWTDVKIRVILKNTFYSGQVFFGKTRIITDPRTDKTRRIPAPPETVTTAKGLHSPLWDAPTQQRIEDEFKKRGKKYAGIRTHRLSHLLYCGTCGSRCWVQYPGGNAKDSTRQWTCSKDSTHVTRKDTQLLPAFVDELTRLLTRAQAAPIPQADTTPEQSATQQNTINELNARLQRIQEAYEANAMTLPEYTTRKTQLKEQLTQAQAQLQHIQNHQHRTAQRLQIIGGFQGILKKIPAYLTQAPPQEVNTQLRAFIHKIIITPTTVTIELIE